MSSDREFLTTYKDMYVVIEDRRDAEEKGHARVKAVVAAASAVAARKQVSKPATGFIQVTWRIADLPANDDDLAMVRRFIVNHGVQPVSPSPTRRRPRQQSQPSGYSPAHFYDEWEKARERDEDD